MLGAPADCSGPQRRHARLDIGIKWLDVRRTKLQAFSELIRGSGDIEIPCDQEAPEYV